MRTGRLLATTTALCVGTSLLVPAPAGASVGDVPRTVAAPAVQAPAAPVDELTVDELPVDVGSPEAPAAEAVQTTEQSSTGRIVSESVVADGYQTLGVTWDEMPDAPDVDVRVRTLTDGRWSAWSALDDESVHPDAGTAEAARDVRAGTGSVWIDGASRVQVSFGAAAQEVEGVRIALVGPVDDVATAAASSGTEAAASPDAESSSRPTGRTSRSTVERGVAQAVSVRTAVGAPGIITRAGWGAAPQRCAFDVASTLLASVVHHTAGPNSYSSVAEAMAQLRADQKYHQDARGWCDLGYNYVVDKWGNVYEGRAGSGERPVIGVHAGGFNTATVGISMLGDYSSLTPGAAQQESVARLIAWRMSAYHRDPGSTVGYTTLGGENSRYPAGTYLALPVVIGHRDVAFTACPGQAAYSLLGAIKQRARALIGAQFVNPSLSSGSVPIGGALNVNGGVTSTIGWSLTITDERTGVQLVRRTGTAPPSGGGAIAGWDGRTDGGGALGPGPYRLTLDGTDASNGAPVVSYTAPFTVTGSQNPPPVAPVALGSRLRFQPIAPARLVDTRLTGASLGPVSRMDLKVAGVAGVPANAKAVALNVTAVGSSTMTFLRMWPAGSAMPQTSNLNNTASATTASGAFVGVGGEGKVSIYNNAGSTHVVVDITGYFTDDASGSGYTPLVNGARLLDSRTDGSRMTSAQTRRVQVAGRDGIPVGATAVMANITSAMPAGLGNISAYPSGGARPLVSSVNHVPGDNVTNRQAIALGPDGSIELALQGASADVLIDVVGWFGPSGAQLFNPMVPARAVDTRQTGGPLGPQAVRTVDLRTAGLPAQATAAVVTLTATEQTAGMTFLTAWRTGEPRALASDLNTGRGRDQANVAVPGTGADGAIQVYNDLGATHLVVDLQGWFGP